MARVRQKIKNEPFKLDRIWYRRFDPLPVSIYKRDLFARQVEWQRVAHPAHPVQEIHRENVDRNVSRPEAERTILICLLSDLIG